MLESNQLLAIIDRGLDLRANPAWCAVRELNPHLLGVGQLFWSVELPAQRCFGPSGMNRTSVVRLWAVSSAIQLQRDMVDPLATGFQGCFERRSCQNHLRAETASG